MALLRVKSLMEATAFVREHNPEIKGLVAMPFDEDCSQIFACDEHGAPVGSPLVCVDAKQFLQAFQEAQRHGI
jgi:hypothetical protein